MQTAPESVARLFEGGRLRCPNDGRLRAVTAYDQFDLIEQFADELNVVMRCKDCGHIFSPTSSVASEMAA